MRLTNRDKSQVARKWRRGKLGGEGAKSPLIPSFGFAQDRLFQRGKLKKGELIPPHLHPLPQGERTKKGARLTIELGMTFEPRRLIED
jgi:hypothetical protein